MFIEDENGLKTFEISEELWLNGEGEGNSFLFRENDAKMCCLGSFCLAAGLSKSDIFYLKAVAQINNVFKKDNSYLTSLLNYDHFTNSEIANKLMIINDDETISIEERKEKLTAKFKEIGYHPIFVK